MKHIILCLLIPFACLAQRPAFPLKISENKRYFTDQAGKPFLYTADTGWQIFMQLTTEEAVEYMAFRQAQGFNTIQVQVVMAPEQVSRYGQKPFLGDVDFSKPNEAYHDHVARVIAKADSMGLLIVMSQPWLGCCKEGFGNTPEKPIQKNGPAKNRSYGRYLGRKFAKFKNLLWIAGGDNDPKTDRESLFAFIEGLYETAPKHQLITYHASPPHSSTDLFQYAPWLGFSFIYTYWREKPNDWVTGDLLPHVYEAALREWSKSDVMPFVLGEAQYEGSGAKKDNDMGVPQIVRRQAYWTMLCGGAGHAYGSDIWYFPPDWRDIMRYPGAYQMGHVVRFFEQIPWWTLAPDVRHQGVVSGYGDWAKPNYVTTAVSDDKRLLVSYLPQIGSVSVDFNYLTGSRFRVRWYNPQTGKFEKESTVDKKTTQRLGPVTGEDWVLLVEAI
ncbi:MAG: glycoside hydrolase family 140 protein [Cytophagales bacterium]|jgi:hypothetical protein|nr:glycoside hydrolase family 140 protein [Cytophagales bacterium]